MKFTSTIFVILALFVTDATAVSTDGSSASQQAENIKDGVKNTVKEGKDEVGVDRSAFQKAKDFVGIDKSAQQEMNDQVGNDKSVKQHVEDL